MLKPARICGGESKASVISSPATVIATEKVSGSSISGLSKESEKR